MKTLLTLLFLLVSAPCLAVPVFDARTISTGTGVSSVSFTHNIGGTCANNIVLVSIGFIDSNTITAVTVDGNAATNVAGREVDAITRRVELWRRLGVTTGARTVAVTFSDASGVASVSARSYCDVDQTTPLGTAATADSVGTSASVTVTSATGDLVVDVVIANAVDTTAITKGGSQTERTNDTTFLGVGYYILGESEAAGAATVNMTWTFTGAGADYWGQIGVSLKPAAVAATVVRHRVTSQ